MRSLTVSTVDWLRVAAVGVGVMVGAVLAAWLISLALDELGILDDTKAALDPCSGITDRLELEACKDYWHERGALERAP